MPLPSFLQRKPPSKAEPPRRGASAGDDPAPLQAARTRARRRLIGAVVLLALGVIGFPLLFETQPRPPAVDIPVQLARKGVVETAVRPVEPPAPRPAPAIAPVEPATEPVRAPVAPAPIASPSAAKLPMAASAAAAPATESGSKPAPTDGARARALLEAAPAVARAPVVAPAPAAAQGSRYVVQVGAYASADALREARQKVERLGLRTYTQVVDTEAGKRTRVRIGPFDTRDEAQAASARLKSAGLPGSVLAL
jgi:DedD protein